MSFDFSGKKSAAEKTEKSLQGLSAEDRAYAIAYRDRAQQERKRFANATDTEFWLCLCFRSQEQLGEWHKAFGFGENHGLARYEDVKDSLGIRHARKSSMVFGAGPSFCGGMAFGAGPSFGADQYDPLAGVEYKDDLEADSLSELEALHDAFVHAKAPDPLTDVTDSDIWTVIVFADRDAKDGFLADVGATRDQQDKYVDAAKLAAHLGVTI